MKKINALVTGASRGIGFAIADVLSKRCKNLFITSKNENTINDAFLKLKTNCNVSANHSDHSNPEKASEEILNWIKNSEIELDAIILDAGIFIENDLSKITDSDFTKNYNVNLLANHKIIQKLLPLLKKNLGARIIIIGSTAAYEPYPIVPSYGVVKWGLRGYAINLRKELMHDGIGVSFVSPGGTLTDMWAGEDLPPNRLLSPYDIAIMIDSMFDLSPQAVVDEIIIRPMLGDMHE